MENKKPRIGFALCGSFCTFTRTIAVLEKLARDYDIYPIMSEVAFSTDTRFGKSEDFRTQIKNICRREIIHTVKEAEPIGPKKILDALIIAPARETPLQNLRRELPTAALLLRQKHIFGTADPLSSPFRQTTPSRQTPRISESS